VVKQFKKNF